MSKMMAKDILFKSRRFDLLIKYIYLKYLNVEFEGKSFFEKLYLDHIKLFNNFKENDKKSPKDFISSFIETYHNIEQNGFDESISTIPVDDEMEPTNGAHRLAICTYLDKDVVTSHDNGRSHYDYKYFKRRGMSQTAMDYVALECTKNNPNAYVLNLHSVADKKLDSQAEAIIAKYAKIFYKKDVKLTEDGYINLKIVSYKHDNWIGKPKNEYKGAKNHALSSMGKDPLRAYVLLADSLELMVQLKAELRELYQKENFAVHITDTQDQAVDLAEILFNENSLDFYNQKNYLYKNKRVTKYLKLMDAYMEKHSISKNDMVIIGSFPLGIMGVREINDVDFISSQHLPPTGSEVIGADNGDEHILHIERNQLIYNPANHFYYEGYKIISLGQLKAFKKERGARKDRQDIKKFRSYIRVNYMKKIYGFFHDLIAYKIFKPKYQKRFLKLLSVLLPVKKWRESLKHHCKHHI